MSNPDHYIQSEEHGMSGNDHDVEMDSNPAYTGVEYTADQGEGAVRAQIRVQVYQLRCISALTGVLLYSKHCNCIVKLTAH